MDSKDDMDPPADQEIDLMDDLAAAAAAGDDGGEGELSFVRCRRVSVCCMHILVRLTMMRVQLRWQRRRYSI
jgi:hypothetical protein